VARHKNVKILKIATKVQKWFTILLVSIPCIAVTQTSKYPVKLDLNLAGSGPVYLSDYLNPDKNLLNLYATFTDLEELEIEVYLTFTIEGNGITLSSKPDYKPATPIILTAGELTKIDEDILMDLFQTRAINYTDAGNQSTFENLKLPEGFYTFCFQVNHYQTNKRISERKCRPTHFKLVEPPQFTAPSCNKVITETDVQNIYISWQTYDFYLTDVEYILKIYELTDENADPATAIDNRLVRQIFESDPILNTNSFNYDVNAPELETSKKYIAQLQANQQEGKAIYKNGGKSQPIWFNYGYPTNGVINIISPEDGHNFTIYQNYQIRWDYPYYRTLGRSPERVQRWVVVHFENDRVARIDRDLDLQPPSRSRAPGDQVPAA
jgi:hypothetical protein